MRLSFYENGDWLAQLHLLDDEGLPVDLSGLSLSLALRDRLGRFAMKLSDGDGLVVADAAAGCVNLDISVSRHKNIVPGLYRFDMVSISGDGARRNILRGTMHIRRGQVEVPGRDDSNSVDDQQIVISGGTF